MWAPWSESIRRPAILFVAVLALAIALTGCSGVVSAPKSSQPGPPGPPPSVSGVSPTTGPASGGTLITISGTNFVTNATVLVGGTTATGTSVVSATQVRATTPSHAAGNADVQIRNPDGQAATMAGAFTFQASAQVQISTSSLPSGQAGASYQATLAATGGTAPYGWSVVAGALPPGLSLNASTGAITGQPTATGNFPFTIQVRDSSASPQTATQALSISIAASTPQALTITTTSVPPAQMSQLYSVTLQAAGGTPTYTWSIVSGQLPTGLTLLGASGQITGTPSVTGQFTFAVRVVDSSSPQQSATASFSVTVSPPSTQPGLDQYGGALLSPCTGGVKTDWYVEKDANKRWWFCTPEGHRMFWQGIYQVDRGVFNSANLTTKYGSSANVVANWKQDMVLRMKYYGFNALAEGWSVEMAPISVLGSAPNPQKLPFNHILRFTTGGGATVNRYGIAAHPIKHLYQDPTTCDNTVHPVPPPDTICYHSRWGQLSGANINQIPDFYDPAFNAYVDGKSKAVAIQAAGSYPLEFGTWNTGTPVDHSWVTGFVPDDMDDLRGMGSPGCGNGTNGQGWAGEDTDCHGHLGLAIATSNPYYTMNLGPCYGCGLPCEPAGSCNPYADNVNHTKAAWITYLKATYSNSISALNTAWNTGGFYTTFDIQAGYPRSTTGSTGVMDEDGVGAWWGSLDFQNLSGMNANLKQDLDNMLENYTGQYYSVVKTTLNTYYPGIPIWTAAPQCGHHSGPRDGAVRGAMKYVDVYDCNSDPRRPQILQHVYDLGCQVRSGCVPIVSSMYITAQADSRAAAGGQWSLNADWPTQTARAGNFGDALINWGGVFGLAFLTNAPNGDFMYAGMQNWSPVDTGEGGGRNWGFLTEFDNPYDGKTTVTGVVSCPLPASIQTSPVVQCGREASIPGLPFGDFMTPLKALNGKWLIYIP